MPTSPRTSAPPKHPMRVVIRRTGLSADVLRAWEKRYAAVVPARTAGGQRLYSDLDLERLALLQRVTEGGRAISQVARLSADELRSLLVEDTTGAAEDAGTLGGDARPPLGRLLAATEQLDGHELERLLRQAVLRLGTATTIEELLVPFAREIGARWHRNEMSPAHEHLASAVMERVLHWALEAPRPAAGAPRIVVATTQGERHELGLLMVAAVASGEDWRVIYLGSDLPTQTIIEATRQAQAQVLAISLVAATNGPTLAALRSIREALGPDVALVVGGKGAEALQAKLAGAGIRVLPDLAQLRAFLRTFPSRLET